MPVGLNENPVGLIDPACPLDWSHPLNRGLVSRWKVIPNSGWRGGLTFRDLVRGGKNPHNGTLASATWGVKNKGPGISISGTGSGVDCGSSGWSSLTDAITVELSYQLLASTADKFHFGRIFDGSNSSFGILNITETSQNIGFAFYNGSWHAVCDPSSIVVGRNYHVVGTYDRVNLKLYIDGRLVATTAESAALPSSTSVLSFGNSGGWIGPQTMFVYGGSVFNRTFSATEVSQLYQEQLRGSPETLRWVGARTYGFSDQAAATGGTPIFSSGIFQSRIIGGGGIVA